MSYYRGDFYQGDPGFLGGFTKILGGAASFLPGVGGIIGKGITALGQLGKKAAPVVAQHPTLSAAGAAGAGAAAAGTAALIARKKGGMGAPRMGTPRAPRMAGMGGKRRRMRVTNPKALRRAIRRAAGFEKLARKVLRFTSPHKARGRAHFKFRKRAR